MKRILFARRTYGFGGVEVILLDWLKRFDYSSYEAFVCSPKDVFSKKIADAGLPAKFISLSESEILRIYGRYAPEEGVIDLVQRSFWHFFPIWLRFLWSIKPDQVVFLDGDFFTTPLACVLAAYIVTNGNVSITIHSPSRLQEPLRKITKYRLGVPDLGIWWYPRVWWPLVPWKIRAKLVNRVLTSNRSMQDKVVRFFGFPEEKMGLVSHGVDVTTFKPDLATRNCIRREWGIPDDAIVIASTSRLNREKRVDHIVGAFEKIAAQNPSAWLVMTGEGPLKGQIENLIRNSKGCERIKLLGHVRDIVHVLQGADMFVLASEFEGLPIALMEAMASGLICLMSNIPGPDEMIENGCNGFLIEASPEGVLAGFEKALALTAQQREEMADKARATVLEKYELEQGIHSAFEQLGIEAASRNPIGLRGSELPQIQEKIVR